MTEWTGLGFYAWMYDGSEKQSTCTVQMLSQRVRFKRPRVGEAI